MKMNYDSVRGQCVVLLLGSLQELGGRSTKQQVLQHIADRNYFAAEAEDRLPFPTALESEPRWELLMSLAWKTCAEGGSITECEGHYWQLSAKGSEFYKQAINLFREGTFDAHRCFLWAEGFKKVLVPTYIAQPDERHRPALLYHDLQRHLAMATAF
jgi:hypothetical protein